MDYVQQDPVGEEPELTRMGKVPIIRGWDGKGTGSLWETIGSGRKVVAFRQWVQKQQIPSDWKQRLGESFVEDVLNKEWVVYVCPRCNKHI